MAKTETSTIVEIEIDSPRNRQLRFRPLQRTLRGRFDFNRIAEPQAKIRLAEWPDPIPGLRLVLDTATGEAAIVEPIYSEGAVLERITRRGMRLGPAREEFKLDDAGIATWGYWMRAAVRAGNARIVRGEFAPIDEAKVRRSFLHPPRVSQTDRLVAALERQSAALEALFGRLASASCN